MKKTHSYIKGFLISRYKLSVIYCTVHFLISCIACVYSALIPIVAVYFAFSLITILRLITYKTGKIPFLMTDKTWEKYRLKYSEEDLEQRYKEMSIKRAACYFIIYNVSFLVWVICEVLMFLV